MALWIRRFCICTPFHSSCMAVLLALLDLRVVVDLHFVDRLELYLRRSRP